MMTPAGWQATVIDATVATRGAASSESISMQRSKGEVAKK